MKFVKKPGMTEYQETEQNNAAIHAFWYYTCFSNKHKKLLIVCFEFRSNFFHFLHINVQCWKYYSPMNLYEVLYIVFFKQYSILLTIHVSLLWCLEMDFDIAITSSIVIDSTLQWSKTFTMCVYKSKTSPLCHKTTSERVGHCTVLKKYRGWAFFVDESSTSCMVLVFFISFLLSMSWTSNTKRSLWSKVVVKKNRTEKLKFFFPHKSVSLLARKRIHYTSNQAGVWQVKHWGFGARVILAGGLTCTLVWRNYRNSWDLLGRRWSAKLFSVLFDTAAANWENGSNASLTPGEWDAASRKREKERERERERVLVGDREKLLARKSDTNIKINKLHAHPKWPVGAKSSGYSYRGG